MAENEAKPIELRLAVVCYGGVALAIYMHGVTKEFHKLVQASRALEDRNFDPVPPDTGLTDTALVYYAALADCARRGHKVRVVVDVITGTSAGGINGVVLGKAIAANADQNALKDLWLDAADIRKLLRPRFFGPPWVRIAVAMTVQLVLAASRRAPLSGAFLSQQLIGALDNMGAGHGSLLTGGDSLDLYVTTTDMFGSTTGMPDGTGKIGQKSADFARAMQFRAAGGVGDFSTDFNPGLAFAARATSSFPGAFAPVSLSSFADEAKLDIQAVDDRVTFTYDYRESSTAKRNAWFVDGGLLDNAPFDYAVDAIARHRSDSQVVRRLTYIEPDPRIPLDTPQAETDPTVANTPPRWYRGVFKAVIGAKGSHSFSRDLIRLRDMNLQIRQVGAMATAQEAWVRAAMADAGVLTDDGLLAAVAASPEPGVGQVGVPTQVRDTAVAMNNTVADRVGAGYPNYVRVKADTAIDYFSAAVGRALGYGEGSNAAAFLAGAARHWVRLTPAWADQDPTQLGQLLINFDMPYRERRLHFVLAAINELYVDDTRQVPNADLDELKFAAWTAHAEIGAKTTEVVTTLKARGMFGFLPTPNPNRYPDAEPFADQHFDEFEIMVNEFCTRMGGQPGEYSRVLWNRFLPITAKWPVEIRNSLLTRYIGFPLWDAMIYPIVALAKLPQYSEIGVEQFSPLAATSVPLPPDRSGKLCGAGTFHFGGFFSRAWRENDYLWGRLDTVERLLGIVRSAADPADTPTPAASVSSIVGLPPFVRDGLRAVMNSEAGLSKIPELQAHMRSFLRE